MATTGPPTDQLPLMHNSSQPPTSPPPFSFLPPDYYAPPTPPPRETRPRARTSPQRSVRFQSPPADPPRRAPDNHSLLPPYTPRANQYKGHKSEAEYLAALRAWAVDKDMVQPTDKCVLPGLYGKETMEECILKHPKLRDGRGKKGRREGERGRGSVFRAGEVVEGGEGVEPRRRKSSFGQWLSRKRTN